MIQFNFIVKLLFHHHRKMLKSNWKKLEAKLVFVFHWPLNSENRIFFFLIPNLMELMMVIGDENKILSRITFLLRATGRDSLSFFLPSPTLLSNSTKGLEQKLEKSEIKTIPLNYICNFLKKCLLISSIGNF